MPQTGEIASLYTYPVKGLSAQRLLEVELLAGDGFPGDRKFALARAGGRYFRGIRQPIPKHEFFMLAKEERLAG